MIIKRFTSGDFVELYPKTRAQQVFSNSDVAVFDENNKIKEAFLPNSVFDSLYIFGTVGAGTTQLRELGLEAVADALAENRSAIGYYWVATANAVISGFPGGQGTVTVNGIVASTAGVNPSEEGVASNIGVAIETGDWFILTRITGAGTVESPFSFIFATVNNTYETASATVHGIVKLGFTSSTANREYKVQTTADGLFVNVPEVTLAVGQTPGFSGLISLADKTRLDSLETNATHTGEVTGDVDLTITDLAVTEDKIAAGAVTVDKIGTGAVETDKIEDLNVTTAKIAAEAVTNDKLAKMPKFTVKGNNLGTPETAAALDLTTAQLRNITNTVSVFFQSAAPTAHADGVALQEGTLWFQIPAA